MQQTPSTGARLCRPSGRARRSCWQWAARLLACLLTLPAHALDPDKALHHYVADSWKLDAGLPQIQVTALAQGPQGYIWIGTRGGLARFDGVSFRTFVPENTPQLQGMIIGALHRDRHDRLWIGTYKGVTIYEDGHFRALPFADSRDDETLRSIDVRDFEELPDGTMVVASDHGLLESNGEGLHRWRDASESTHSLLVQDGAIWAGELGRVRIFGRSISEHHLPEGKGNARVKSLVAYHGTIWAATSRGLIRWTGSDWVSVNEPAELADSPVDALHVDQDDVLWVATSEGLLRLNGNEPLPAAGEGHAHAHVQAITEDHEGNLWLGSDTSGLARLRNGWTRRFSAPEGLHEPTVWSLMPHPDGSIWVGTTQGLSRFADGRFHVMAFPDELPHPGIYTLLVEDERVWLGTRAGLAVYVDGRVEIPPGTEMLADAQISSILAGDSGEYWLATSKGLCRYQAPTLRCFGREAGLHDPRLRFVLVTHEGRVLAGSQGGLFELRQDRLHPIGDGVISPNDDITALHQLSDGTLVVGTLAEALYTNSGDGWQKFTTADGLPINSPFYSALDDQGNLWVSGLQGLYHVPYAQLPQRRRDEIDQLDARMLLNERGDVRGAQHAYCCNGAGRAKGFMRDGELWLPTRDGIIAVNTSDVRANPHPPNVVIERLRVGGTWHDYHGAPVALNADSRELAVQFTALSFQAPGSVYFRYRLHGFDEQWQTPDDMTQRTAYYTNLPAGEYEFQVKAANNAEVWQEQPATARVTVEPYFYETKLFYLLVIGVLAGAFYAGYRLLLINQRRQRERLRALVEARTEELRVANEHLREYSRRLEEASRTDPLTGLWNRRYLEEQLPQDLALFQRQVRAGNADARVKVFAVVDLDRFKALNDRFGHGAGDQVLREFAALVSALVRPGDYVVRWGGEEFVIVLREMAPESAEEALRRILEAVAYHPFRLFNQQPLHITCSIGYTFYPFLSRGSEPLSWEQTIEIADLALYAAKEAGRGRCVGFHPADGIRSDLSVAEIRNETASVLASGRLRQTEFNLEPSEAI